MMVCKRHSIPSAAQGKVAALFCQEDKVSRSTYRLKTELKDNPQSQKAHETQIHEVWWMIVKVLNTLCFYRQSGELAEAQRQCQELCEASIL